MCNGTIFMGGFGDGKKSPLFGGLDGGICEGCGLWNPYGTNRMTVVAATVGVKFIHASRIEEKVVGVV